MTTQGPDPPKAAVSGGGMGIAYKVGLGVMVAGGIFLMSREILGDIAYSAISGILELLGAPEERDFLPTNEPEAG